MPNSHLFATCKLCDYLNKNIQSVFMFIIFLMSFLLATTVHSATINASSCSQSDVQSAIDSASTGDIVVVPAGQCTWDSSVSIPSGVTLQGAGIAQTVITRGEMSSVISLGDNSRVTEFEFVSGIIHGNKQNWRIDHCKLTHTNWDTGIIVNENSSTNKHATGLIDNCSFTNLRIVVFGDDGYSDDRWYENNKWGDNEEVIFVEDCTWDNTSQRSSVDGRFGGRYVARYNILNNAYFEGHGARDQRGIQTWEIYRNTFNNSWEPMTQSGNMRGGSGVIFDNTFTGDASGSKWRLGMERAYTSYPYSGKCDGTSAWDGNEPGQGGALCRDQIGAGPDTQLGPGEADKPPYEQTKRPAYFWNNVRDGGVAVDIRVAYGLYLILENRDFYIDDSENNDRVGGGVTIGTLANRPSTCTPGVAYWATDQGSWNKKLGGEQGVLYKCTTPNNWEKYYEPYEYPHPLTKETALSAPELMLKDTFSGGSVWTKSTGKTYTYYLTSKKYGGRHIKKVTEDGAELVETASVDLCESTTGSYFVDPSDGTVHVHCTDGADPDTHEIGVYYN